VKIAGVQALQESYFPMKRITLTVSGLGPQGLTGFTFWFTAKMGLTDPDSAVVKKLGQQTAPT
jgi:hypothetical protein